MSHVQSVRSAVRIMELLGDGGFLGVSDIARSLDLPKASVFRVIHTLADAGWLKESHPDSREWGVAGGFARRFAHSTVGFSDAAAQAVAAGRDETGETTYVVVPSDGALMVVYRAESRQGLTISLPIATLIPFDVSTTGAAYLSRLPASERKRILTDPTTLLQNPDLAQRADLMEDLDARIARAHADGFATAQGLWRSHIGGVGAPIVDASGSPVGAVGLSFPLSRLPDFSLERTGEVLSRLAREISLSV